MSTNNNTFGNNIELATQKLMASELVAFPTETVYGLGADATNLIAIKKVFAVKGRPSDHPLIVHISGIDKIELWAKNISVEAYKLAEHFWPGPLTLILAKKDTVLSVITAGQDSVALRVPRHPYALALLRNFNGLVGPSANKYGRISPTSASHVLEDFDSKVGYVLDGGPCAIGIESTIIDCRDNNIKILRSGGVLASDIARVLQRPIVDKINIFANKNNSTLNLNIADNNSVDDACELKVPGLKSSHYAPQKPLYVLSIEDIADKLNKALIKQTRCAVLSFIQCPDKYKNTNVSWYRVDNNPATFNKLLYKNMRDMDRLDVDELIIEKPEENSAWVAALDRLGRASSD